MLELAEQQESQLEGSRKARQLNIISNWYNKGGVGTAECVTGFGKTTMTLLLLKRYRKSNADKSYNVIVVVPTLFLKNQWETVLAAWGLDFNIEVHTIQSIITREEKLNCHFLILDEIHMYGSKEFSNVFDYVKYEIVLGLTGTMRDGNKRRVIEKHCPVIDTVTVKEALDNNWVAPFTIFNFGVDLDPADKKKYNELSAKVSSSFAWFNHDIGAVYKSFRNKAYRKAHGQTIGKPPGFVVAQASKFNTAMNKRKKLLQEYHNKVDKAIEIIKHFEGRLIISFCLSIDMADDISDKLGDIAMSYHSKTKSMRLHGRNLTKKQTKRYIIGRFADPSSDVRVLSTAKSLDMGADIPSIDMGIIVSGNSSSIQGMQRLGRTIRLKEDRKAIFIEMYVRNTKDEEWLRSRQRKIPRSLIKTVTSIEQIEKHLS